MPILSFVYCCSLCWYRICQEALVGWREQSSHCCIVIACQCLDCYNGYDQSSRRRRVIFAPSPPRPLLKFGLFDNVTHPTPRATRVTATKWVEWNGWSCTVAFFFIFSSFLVPHVHSQPPWEAWIFTRCTQKRVLVVRSQLIILLLLSLIFTTPPPFPKKKTFYWPNNAIT